MLPRLYAILDADILGARALDPVSFATELRDSGVKLMQYRSKQGTARSMLKNAALLREIFPAGGDVRLILNDRADLTLLANFDGVHVGQDDLSAEQARAIVGSRRWVGVSTHSSAQVMEAEKTSCDYIAYGPVFSTASKENPDPTVGLDGLKAARKLTKKPLVAIGGITRQNCRAVIDAGADSIAVISGLLPQAGQTVRRLTEDFLALLG